jgi:hypothetical protein
MCVSGISGFFSLRIEINLAAGNRHWRPLRDYPQSHRVPLHHSAAIQLSMTFVLDVT